MQIPCTHGAPFSSLLSRNGSCLPRQDILGLVDGIDQAVAYWQIYTIVRPRDGVRAMRARTQYVAQTIVPSRPHRHDVPEVEFKTPILATLRDFCFSSLSWVRQRNRYVFCTTFTSSHWRSRSMTRTPPNPSAALAALPTSRSRFQFEFR